MARYQYAANRRDETRRGEPVEAAETGNGTPVPRPTRTSHPAYSA